MDEELTEPVKEADTEVVQGEEPAAALDVTQANLVPQMLGNEDWKKWLTDLVSEKKKSVKEDDDSRRDWMKQNEEIMKLFGMQVPDLPYPTEGIPGSNDNTMTKTILQLVSRWWDQVYPSKGSVVNAKGVGMEDDEQADRVDQHMNWQIREKIPFYGLGLLVTMNRLALFGSTFRAKWYDPTINCTRFDPLTADDVIVAYTRKDIDPLMRDVPQVTRVRRYARHRIEELGRAGFYFDVKRLFKDGVAQAPGPDDESDIQRTADKMAGIERSTASYTEKKSAPRVIYEVNYWGVLPGEEEQRPLKLTFDKWSGLPLALSVREEDDPMDAARFQADMKAFELESQNLTGEFQQAMQQWQEMGGAEMGLPEPPQPQLPQQPEPQKRRALFDIIHFGCFDNPQGFYKLGIGHLLLHSTKYSNGLQNVYMVACLQAAIKGGFAPKGGLGKRGEIKMKPGMFVETEMDASEMSGLRPFEFNGPPESLHKLLAMVKEESSTMVADIDTMSGEAGPTNETGSAAKQRMFNATQLITNTVRVFIEALKEEPRMIAADNALYLDEREVFWVTEPSKEDPAKEKRVQREVGRADYANVFDITFTADQRTQTKPERIQTSNNVIDRLNSSPYAKDPEKGPLLYHAAFTSLFKALEDPSLLAALGPPPQPKQPPPPPQPMSQEDENMGYFMDQYHPALPTDPHEEHIQALEVLYRSPYFQQLSATGKSMAEKHRAEHFGMMYRKEVGANGQAGAGGLAGPGGNAGVPVGAGGPPGGPPGQAPNGGPPNAGRAGPGAGGGVPGGAY